MATPSSNLTQSWCFVLDQGIGYSSSNRLGSYCFDLDQGIYFTTLDLDLVVLFDLLILSLIDLVLLLYPDQKNSLPVKHLCGPPKNQI